MFKKKSLILVSALSMAVLFGCSDGDVKSTKENKETIEAIAKEETTPLEQVLHLSYKDAAERIAAMTAEELEATTDVRAERIKLMTNYAEQYEVSEADSIQFAADLINDYTANTYLKNINNDEIMLAKVFKATIVRSTAEDALVDFAEHYNDSIKNLFLKTYEINSEFVQKNKVEMDKALQLALNMQIK